MSQKSRLLTLLCLVLCLLFCVPAQSLAANPPDYERAKAQLQRLKEGSPGANSWQACADTFRKVYDYIIIDGPPLGLVVDSAIIAKSCDGAAIVVAAGMVKYRFVQTVKENLLNAGCPVLGVILNKVDRDSGGKYYRKHYGKYYGEYYGKG